MFLHTWPFCDIIIYISNVKETKMAFEKSTKKVQMLDSLASMQQSLRSLGSIPNDIRIYDYAVHFFNIIAQFQDKHPDISILKNDKNKESIASLAKHISNAGREPYGWVRAKKNQPVTLDNLYLGNVAGLWTMPAAKFKSIPDDKYVQDNIQAQLRGFIKSHREPMMDLIGKITRETKKPNNIFFRLFGAKEIQSQK